MDWNTFWTLVLQIALLLGIFTLPVGISVFIWSSAAEVGGRPPKVTTERIL